MLKMISSELNLKRFTVHQILTQDLGMRKLCAKMVPKNLTTEQNANRRDVCLDLLDHLEREPEFFIRVIRGDESWILEYDPEESTRNLWHQDKLSIKLFIGKSLKDSGKRWRMCDQALHALGCCTTTTPHVTWQSPSMNFWQKKAFLLFLSPPIHRISVPVTSFYSPGSKTT